MEEKTYDEWLTHLTILSSKDTLPPGWVQASTFLVVREEDDRIVGMADIRYWLNEKISIYGGHIGYGVRPSERKKGYALQILQLALKFCRDLGMEKVMLSCLKENEGSRRTILAGGGVPENEFVNPDGFLAQNFWITL